MRTKTDWKNEPKYKDVDALLIGERATGELLTIRRTIKRVEAHERHDILWVFLIFAVSMMALTLIAGAIDWYVTGARIEDYLISGLIGIWVFWLFLACGMHKYKSLTRRIDETVEARVLGEDVDN